VRRLIQYIPERQVMLITGHKTRSILERYHIITERDLLEVWRNFGGDGKASAETLKMTLPMSPQPIEKGGGSVWESNPPSRVLAPITGFEVQAAHQHRYASAEENQKLTYRMVVFRKSFFVRAMSAFLGSKPCLGLGHSLTNILSVRDPVAIINRIGLVACDLLGGLSRHSGSIHSPQRFPSR
jgi:hypothetical protein